MDKRLVVIEWDDAACTSGWQDAGTIITPHPCFTAGWLLHEDEKFVMVAGTMYTDGSFNQTMTIPKAMLHTIKDA